MDTWWVVVREKGAVGVMAARQAIQLNAAIARRNGDGLYAPVEVVEGFEAALKRKGEWVKERRAAGKEADGKPAPGPGGPAVVGTTDKKLRQAAAAELAAQPGTCPAQMFGWERPGGCVDVCKVWRETACWGEYMEEKAREGGGA